jgi:N-acetylmuramoyl-L-alanine amidase-like protein
VLPRYPDPLVFTRAQWRAARPVRGYTAQKPVCRVVLHHTSWAAAHLIGGGVAAEVGYMRAIQRSHLARDWIDVGYHFVVMPSGRIFFGRPLSAIGAHVAGHNTGSAGVSLAGDFDREEPTAAAIRSIDYVLDRLVPGGTRLTLVGHRDLADTTTCPGAALYPYVDQRNRALFAASALAVNA